jgi:hypothetical protein
MSDDEIFTIRDIPVLFKVVEKAIYAMAQSGGLPEFKVCSQWRSRSDTDVWIASQLEHSQGRPEDGGGDE